jgi:hypothetical protein
MTGLTVKSLETDHAVVSIRSLFVLIMMLGSRDETTQSITGSNR